MLISHSRMKDVFCVLCYIFKRVYFDSVFNTHYSNNFKCFMTNNKIIVSSEYVFYFFFFFTIFVFKHQSSQKLHLNPMNYSREEAKPSNLRLLNRDLCYLRTNLNYNIIITYQNMFYKYPKT